MTGIPRLLVAALGLTLLLASPAAYSQQVIQGGPSPATPGHAPRFITNQVIGDSGPANGGPPGYGLTELNITNNTGIAPECINDAPVTNSAGYHQLCFGANVGGQGLISYNAYGGAQPLPLNCLINGQSFPCINTGHGNVVGPTISIPGDAATWSSSDGTLLGDPGAPPILSVPTNAALKALGTPLNGIQLLTGGGNLLTGGTNLLTENILVAGETAYRAGLFAAGDGFGATYIYSLSPCSLNGGAGDNDLEVQPNVGTGCWLNTLTQLSLMPTITWSGSGTGSHNLAAYWTQEKLSGTSNAPSGSQLAGNQLAITDNLVAPPPIYAMSAWDVEDNYGAGAQGARNAIKSFCNMMVPPTVKGTPGGNYPACVGIFPGGEINANMGGLTPAFGAGGAAGSLYGINPNVTLGSNATNIYVATGGEFDVTMLPGSSAAQKLGISIVQASTDAVKGSVADAAIFLGNQPGAVGWDCGLCFAGNGSGAAFPITPGGEMISTIGSGGMSAANGINFSNATFSGYAFEGPGRKAFIDGSGNIEGVNVGIDGHLITNTNIPATVSACGSYTIPTGTNSPNDVSGYIFPGASSSVCTITFSVPYGSIPRCTVTAVGVITGALYLQVLQASQIIVQNPAGNFSGTDGFTYHCEQ